MFRAKNKSELESDIQSQLDEIRIQRLFLNHYDLGLEQKEETLRMILGSSQLLVDIASKGPEFFRWVKSIASRESGSAKAEFILHSIAKCDPSLLVLFIKLVTSVRPQQRRRGCV